MSTKKPQPAKVAAKPVAKVAAKKTTVKPAVKSVVKPVAKSSSQVKKPEVKKQQKTVTVKTVNAAIPTNKSLLDGMSKALLANAA